MGMQYDVKSYYTGVDRSAYAGRTRIKGVFYAVTTPGANVLFFDNASAPSGTSVLSLPTAVAGQYTVYIPGEGILCENGIYIDINGASGVTVFYG